MRGESLTRNFEGSSAIKLAGRMLGLFAAERTVEQLEELLVGKRDFFLFFSSFMCSHFSFFNFCKLWLLFVEARAEKRPP